MSELRTIVDDFTSRLTAVLEQRAIEQARQAVTAALGANGHTPPRRGRPPKAVKLAAVQKPRKKAPRQFCPVPNCKNPAAPVFGMVCAKHKDLPKMKIRKFREARRAKKLKAKAA